MLNKRAIDTGGDKPRLYFECQDFNIYTHYRIRYNVVVWKVPVEIDRQLSHHEEHEDHEVKTEKMGIPSSCASCPSWL